MIFQKDHFCNNFHNEIDYLIILAKNQPAPPKNPLAEERVIRIYIVKKTVHNYIFEATLI
jgi:hypothetical protein